MLKDLGQLSYIVNNYLLVQESCKEKVFLAILSEVTDDSICLFRLRAESYII